MNECYSFWIDVFVPLISAIIGGGLTLLGVIWTIKAENKKSKKEYLEKIRPFFVVEPPLTMDTEKNRKSIWINDDYSNADQQGQIVFHLDTLYLSNESESVCMIGYIKINDTEYDALENVPIKAGDLCEIKGAPFSTFIYSSIENISIGLFDKNFNLYEYKVFFEIKDYNNTAKKLEKYKHKGISFNLIDCSKNIASKRRRKQYDYKRKTI